MTWMKGAKCNAHLKKKPTLLELKSNMSDHGISLIYRNSNDRINRLSWVRHTNRYEVVGNGYYRGKSPFLYLVGFFEGIIEHTVKRNLVYTILKKFNTDPH